MKKSGEVCRDCDICEECAIWMLSVGCVKFHIKQFNFHSGRNVQQLF